MATTFATNGQIQSLMVGLKSSEADLLDLARASAYGDIVSALTVGKYATATFTSDPDAWPSLTVLEARIVALDVLGGGAASVKSRGGGGSWTHWYEYVQKHLDDIKMGKVTFVSDDGTVVAAPYMSGTGIDVVTVDELERSVGFDVSEAEDGRSFDATLLGYDLEDEDQ